jgi:hypothetical protein
MTLKQEKFGAPHAVRLSFNSGPSGILPGCLSRQNSTPILPRLRASGASPHATPPRAILWADHSVPRSGRPALPRLANPLPLGPFPLDEPSPIAGPTGSLDCERGTIAGISVALSHDLCTAKRAAHRNQIVTLVQFEHTLCSVALDCWTVVNLSGPVKTFRS